MNYSFDYYKQLKAPEMYLCNPNFKPICVLNGQDRHLALRFNDLSELTFRVDKTKDIDDKDYNRIKTKRLIFLEGIGWFQITNAKENSDGEADYKEVTAESHQTIFRDRGFISEDRAYMFYNENDPTDREYDSKNVAAIPSVIGQLVQQCGVKIATNLSDITPTRDYKQWTIIYIDPILKFKAKSYDRMYESDNENNIIRHFEEENTFGYDFIINKVQSAFNVIFDFDFMYHTIKIKTLDEITVPTDIYLSFDNLMDTLSLTEDAENITTVLSCEGSNVDITTVNPMGTNYIVNFDYYMKEVDDDGNAYPWMSKELITAVKEWRVIWESSKVEYKTLVTELQSKYLEGADLADDVQYTNLKITDLKTALEQYITADADRKNEYAKFPVTVEEIELGKKSLDSKGNFYAKAFDGNESVTAYKAAPTISAHENSRSYYEFTFSGASRTGTVPEMIKDYIMPVDENADPADCYLYFSDGDKESYCKLLISSEVGVAKDGVSGVDTSPIAIPIPFDNGEGYVEVRGAVFKVINKYGTVEVYDNRTGNKMESVNGHGDYFEYNGARHRVVKSADDFITIYCYYVSGFQRFTAYKNLSGEDDGWLSMWEKYSKTLDAKRETIEGAINELLGKIKAINEKSDIQKSIKAQGDALYDEFSHYWIEGNYTNSNIAADTDTSLADKISLGESLMEAGEKELEKASQPTIELTIEAINFTRLLEFEAFTSQLQLGRVITIEKKDGVLYMPALVAIEFDLDSSDNFSLTFSSAARPGETAMTIADLIKEASDTSRTVTSNWADLIDYSKNKSSISSLIEEPLNRALRAAQAGLSNQAFIIDETGILGRRYKDDSQTSFSDEQVRLINNVLIFTDDGWKTAKTALGKTDYGYGLVAEVIVGQLILGERISIGSNSERVTITDQGIIIKNDNGDVVFDADEDGNLTIKGVVYASGGEFKGTVYATGGEFSGTIHAKDGDIGGLLLSENGLSSTNDKFKITSEGILHCDGANISGDSYFNGHIEASSGVISSFNIANNNLGAANGSIVMDAENGTITAKVVTATETLLCDNIKSLQMLNQSGTAGFNFGFQSKDIETVNVVSVRITANSTAIDNNTTYTATISTDKALTEAVALQIKITYGLRQGSMSESGGYWLYNYKYYTVVIGKGSSVGTINNIPRTNGEGGVGWNHGDYIIQKGESIPSTFTQFTGDMSPGVGVRGRLVPEITNQYSLGDGDHYWDIVYSNKGVSTSDAKCKFDISLLEEKFCKDLILGLKPKKYKFIDAKSPRYRYGFIAQDIEELLGELHLTTEDNGLIYKSMPYEKDGKDNKYGLSYLDLIAPLVSVVQELLYKVNHIEDLKR